MKIQFTFVLLAAAMLVSCHSTSQTSGTVTAGPKYTFKKVEMPTISPCVQCVMTSAKQKYRLRRAIPFPACVSGSQDKTYLKLNLKNGSDELKVVLSRNCFEGVSTIAYGYCPTSENCGDSSSNIIVYVDGAPTFFCGEQPILTIEVNSSSVRVVSLASGWNLYYEKVVCPQ